MVVLVARPPPFGNCGNTVSGWLPAIAELYVPVKEVEKQRAKGQDPFAPRSDESPRLTEWRTRMGTAEAQEVYKLRASTAECVNALARQRGLTQFRVRWKGRPVPLPSPAATLREAR